MHQGSCLCGGIRYEFDGEVTRIGLCHCSMCRKASGTAFAANAPVPKDRFRLVKGEDLLRAYASSPGKQRYFCSNCGSPVYSRSESYPDLIRIRLGSLEAPAGRTPTITTCSARKPTGTPAARTACRASATTEPASIHITAFSVTPGTGIAAGLRRERIRPSPA